MKSNYTFHHDPGHSWLEVPRHELHQLGIDHTISHYSYQNGDFVYLEEDCDLLTYLQARFPGADREWFRSWFASSTDEIESSFPRSLAPYRPEATQ